MSNSIIRVPGPSIHDSITITGTSIISSSFTSIGTNNIDLSGNAGTFLTPTGANTFGGSSNSFTNAVSITPTTNQLVLGTTRTITITAPTPASSSRVLTIPDPGAADSFVLLALAQTLTTKTLTAPIINGATSASGNFDLSGSSGTTKTTTGIFTIGASRTNIANFIATTATTALPHATWTAPTLLNSYVDFGTGYAIAGYMKDACGFVHLRGLVKNGTAGATIFTLPTGFRPAYNMIYPGYIDDISGGSYPLGFVRVDSNGNVYAKTGGNNDVGLDYISFYAEG